MGVWRQKFKVILWKSLILRRRHWLLSLFEVVVPLYLFYFLTKYTPKEAGSEHGYVIYNVQRLDDLIYELTVPETFSRSDKDVHQIAYAPFSPVTKELMSRLDEKLSQTAMKDRYNITHLVNEDQLNKWLHSKDQKDVLLNMIGIVFEGVNTQTKLKYKIRVNKENSPSVDELFGYKWDADKYLDNMFLVIQMILDMNFIRHVTGNTLNLGLQKFPDQGYERTSFANVWFPIITTFSFVFIIPAILKKIVEEKQTGIKELQKMMGLRSWMLWTGWLLHSLIVYAVSAILITVMFRYPWPDRIGLLYQVDNWLIIFYLFFLFIITMILFCFAVSTFFISPNLAMIVGILLWLVPPFLCLHSLSSNTPQNMSKELASCLSPPVCLSWGFSIFINFQHKGKEWSWNMFFEKGTTGGLSMAHVVCMFYFDWLLYGLVTWYVDNVKPGPYGRAEPLYFIFQFWKKDTETSGPSEEETRSNFEPPPEGTKIGISIQNLRKVFGSKVAVDKVNLDIYEGEITALLGHNGAGKTTTMSILTGLYSASKGKVVVDGQNIFEDMNSFRQNLGLCPQYNLLFSDFTVIEHLIFFGMLKGLPKDRAEASGLKLLVTFHMVNKANHFVSQLSGGMRRKLCLSISLMGDPKVLMLDEPTSGMDPESRREVWDTLLNYRGARTILITTHFMEEADVLGDRIAIMDHGRVSCYGTSIFLKNLYGTGYHIVISKEAANSEVDITTVIESHLNEPKLKTNLPSQLSYNVSSSEVSQFTDLFGVLEAKKSELGITGISISCTTMEDVFLRVAECGLPSDVKPIPTEILLSTVLPSTTTRVQVEGWLLNLQQLKALYLKKMLVVYRTWLSTIVFCVSPLVAIVLVLDGGSRGEDDHPTHALELSLALYPDTNVPFVLHHHREVEEVFQDLVTNMGSAPDKQTDNISQVLINRVEEDKSYYRSAVVGAEFNRSIITGLYNNLALHAAPVALNLLTNAILRAFNPSASVVVTNHPFSGLVQLEDDCQEDEDGYRVMSEGGAVIEAIPWLLLSCGLMVIVARFIALPLHERANNAKQLQLMCGLSPGIYWLSHFLWDLLLYTVVMILVIALVWLLDTAKVVTLSGRIDLLFFLLLMYGISGIPFAYLISFTTRSSAKAISLFLMFNLLTGIVTPMIMLGVGLNYKNRRMRPSVTYDLVDSLLCLNPLYAETSALVRLVTMMVLDSACRKCSHFCNSLNPFETREKNPWSILHFVIFLMIEWILFWLIIFIIEFGLLKTLSAKVKHVCFGPMFKYTVVEDDDVLEEKQKAKSLFQDSNKEGVQQVQPLLRVCGLGKKYSRKTVAVHDVSFLVERGQCFGLLGVNGAGKTTTFKMLTGEDIPTAGTAAILKYDLLQSKSEYLKEMGYCPQFDALLEELTGEEMLRLFSALRGSPLYLLDSEVTSWLKYMGLEEFAAAQCGTYSGGNRRKLSTAMALIGAPPVVCLDEPTAGVDPVSRRRLWDVLAQCQKAGQAIVLTSHSMEECEALCSRLTILVGGHMKCIGSPQYLKQRFGQGYTFMLKLSPSSWSSAAVKELKNNVNRTFSKCFIKDEHKGLLHYHIADNTVLLSVLFSKLEKLRRTNSIVEDYMVGDTTLEQVFMAFARQTPPTIVIEPVDV